MTKVLVITPEKLQGVENDGLTFQWAGLHKVVSVEALRAAMTEVDLDAIGNELQPPVWTHANVVAEHAWEQGLADARDSILAHIKGEQ